MTADDILLLGHYLGAIRELAIAQRESRSNSTPGNVSRSIEQITYTIEDDMFKNVSRNVIEHSYSDTEKATIRRNNGCTAESCGDCGIHSCLVKQNLLPIDPLASHGGDK